MVNNIELSAEAYGHLVAAEQALAPAITHCEKAERCKMEGVLPLAQSAKAMQEQLQLIRQEFFPNGKPA